MPETERSRAAPGFYRRIGTRGWRDSDYFTFSVRSPAWRDWLAAELPATPRTILSIGCGTGRLEGALAERGHRIIGLDLSPPMLKRARKAGLPALVRADSHALPLAPASVDIVLFAESIGHLRLAEAFAEAARVLRRRGRVIVTTYAGRIETHARYRKFAAAAIEAALQAAGLVVAERRYLAANRNGVAETASEKQATVLYVAARIARLPHRPVGLAGVPGSSRRRSRCP